MINTKDNSKEADLSYEVLGRATIETLKTDPRALFREAVRKKDATSCLIKTAEIHGHFCPGSALGVMASIYGLNTFSQEIVNSDGIMENLLAIVECNACFADGVQAVSGCTLDNNSLVCYFCSDSYFECEGRGIVKKNNANTESF
jgi:formylmethanofuran dehydrogenase subunit E